MKEFLDNKFFFDMFIDLLSFWDITM